MKYLISLLLITFICTCGRAQSEPEPTSVSLAKVSGFTGGSGSYSGTLTITDVYNTNYTGTAIQAGHKFMDSQGRVYDITSVSAPSFGKVNVVLSCLTVPVGSPLGTGQVWIPLSSGMYPAAPARDGELGPYLLSLILSHNATVSSEAADQEAALVFRDTVLTVAGANVSLSVSGPAPVLAGAPGGYTLTIPAGTDWRHLQLTGNAASTSSNDLSLSIVQQAGSAQRATVTLINTGSGEVVAAPKQEFGIVISQTVSGSTATSSFTGIGGLSGFILYFSR